MGGCFPASWPACWLLERVVSEGQGPRRTGVKREPGMLLLQAGPGAVLHPTSLCYELSALIERSVACWQMKIAQKWSDANRVAVCCN